MHTKFHLFSSVDLKTGNVNLKYGDPLSQKDSSSEDKSGECLMEICLKKC